MLISDRAGVQSAPGFFWLLPGVEGVLCMHQVGRIKVEMV